MAGKRTPGLTPVLERNIRLLSERKQREENSANFETRIAALVTRFAGSMLFVYLHMIFFGAWIASNIGLVPHVRPWDPSFVVLAMCASVEAIFLSTFVLIAQNRMSEADAKRADLDLQISLLAEHEITKLATLLESVAKHVGAPVEDDRELQDVKQDVAPGKVLDQLESVKPDA
jgi:uncharacterized membrane protein